MFSYLKAHERRIRCLIQQEHNELSERSKDSTCASRLSFESKVNMSKVIFKMKINMEKT